MTARALLLGERNPLRRRRPSGSVGPRSSVTFPTTRLVSRVQIALGADLSADPLTWAWVDITPWVRFDLGISLTTGRRDEASTVTTGSATLKLDNRDGRFTRRNPTGPYYGLLSKNTPIWATVDAGSGEKTRLQMFVNEWPKTWADKSANDSTVTIRCAGILRRLAQGSTLKSAMRRAILSAEPLAYWPLEDDSDAVTGGSGLSGGTSIAVGSGVVTWAGSTPPAGSVSAPDLSSDGRLIAPVPTSSTTVYTIEFLAKCALAPADVPLALRMSGGTYPYFWYFSQDTGIAGQVVGGTPTVFTDNFGNFPLLADYAGEWHHYRTILKSSGGTVTGYNWVDGVAASVLPGSAITLGQIVSVEVNSNIVGTGITGSVCHVAIYDYEMTDDHSEAMLAYTGEMAHTRLGRLCGDEGVIFETVASTSQAMGPQGVDTLLALLRECEAADGGVLYEKRWGLAYRSLTERYNQPVGLALDIAQGHLADIPEPADDDQRTRNRWTVSRTNGSEYTAEETSGLMGTGTEGPGLYDDSVTINVETDDQLAGQANWRLHLGTVDEDRWPDVGLNFTRQPSLIDTWSALGSGARITIANPVPQMPPDPPDLIIEGYSERWDSKLWTASLNCSPASPYRVNAVGSTDGNVGRVDAANSTLAADATDVATTISVASSGALWRTGAVNFDINVAGERMTVTNISGGSSPQTFTVTRSVNSIVKAQPSSVAGRSVKVSLWNPAAVAL